jgi:hypothetical protein
VDKKIRTETAAGTCGLRDESKDNGTRLINYAVHQIMFIGEHYWEDIIKMNLQELGFGGIDWMELAQDRDKEAGTYECGNEPSGSIKCGEFLD